jgi:hypothetical protein
MGSAAPHPLVEQIADLYLRDGYAPALDGDDWHAAYRARIAAEWQSGQWVMCVGHAERFWGWLSWYRVSDEVFGLIESGALQTLLDRGQPGELLDGPHCYLATFVVAPWAPRLTFRALYRLACAANADAKTICGHFAKRDGRRYWHQRNLAAGAGHLLR